MDVRKTALAFVLVAVLGGALAYAFQQQVLTVYKPVVVAIDFQNLPISLYSVSFNYNESVQRYSNVALMLNNTDGNYTVSVSVSLYAGEVLACSGSWSGVLFGFQTVTVPLSWNGNYTVNDISNGWITIRQQD